jgi:FKBP-type peptidyl-prolyl cis-trans isomerase SlyD
MSIVEKDRVVHIHYRVSEADGPLLDMSGATPLGYLHGHGGIVAGLERALEGKQVGEQVDVVLEPVDGYGERDDKAFFQVHRRELPPGTRFEAGAAFRAEGSGGRAVVMFIDRVQGARCTVTTNHPLAGKRLHFVVEVAAIRGASAEEIAHGHVHEPGHAHH